MQVQVHADDHVQGGESLAHWVQEEVGGKLLRFREHINRVDVYLSDVDALKSSGGKGKRCVLETRPAGRQSLAVNAEAEKVAQAFSGALEKLLHALETDLAKMRDKNNRESIRLAASADE